MTRDNHEVFELGDLVLQRGATMRGARLAYTTYGIRAADRRNAVNLLTTLWPWQHGDVGATPGFGGDLDRALGSISARAIAMPPEKDVYFPSEDEEYEVSRMPSSASFPGSGVTSPAAARTPRTPPLSTAPWPSCWRSEASLRIP